LIKLTNFTHEPSKAFFGEAQTALNKLLHRKDLGFFDLPKRQEIWNQSAGRAQELKKSYKTLAILGIGGSSLGGLAIKESLGLDGLEFFENVDSRDFWKRLNSLSVDQTHWVIVSKSGKTVETLTQANFVSQFLKEKGLDLTQRATVISEIKSNPLTNWARKNNVQILQIPEDVGGRFSVLSPVGLLPAGFGGVDLHQLKEGAQDALHDTELVARLSAFYLASFSEEKWISVFWAYCNNLRYFGLWIEQLWAESLGKKHDIHKRQAPRASTPISLIGANDQHSVLQQIAEGAKDKFVSFLRVKESETYGPKLAENLFEGEGFVVGKSMGELLAAEATATQRALQEANVPSLSLEIDALDARHLGFLFMLFELVVGTMGEALNINAFDQPGVELGKRLAKEILLK